MFSELCFLLMLSLLTTVTFFIYIAFAETRQEQRDYAHRHDVLRDIIPLLLADDQQRR